ARQRRGGPVPPPDRLQQSAGLRAVARRTDRAAVADHRVDRPTDGRRRGGSDRPEAQYARRSADDRRPLRGVRGRREDGARGAGRRRPGDDDAARDGEGPNTSMTRGAARPGASSHLVVVGEPARIVKATLLIAVERMMLHDAEIRRGTDEPEAIHDARVAVRRFRSHVASLSSVLDVDVISSRVEHLGAFARALGAVRDLDVFLEDLAAGTADVPEAIRAEAARIASAVALERAVALEALRRSMDAPEHAHLQRTLMSIAVDPPLRRPAHAPDPAVVMSSVWKALARRAGAAGRSSPDPVLHALRIRAKRVRYAAEALTPLVGDRASAS